MPKRSLVTRGPAWLVYTAYYAISSLALLPAYVAYFSIPWLRARKDWSFTTALSNKFYALLLDYIAQTELATPQVTSLAADLGDLEFIPPAPRSLLQGLLDDAEIQPTQVAGIWVPAKPAVLPTPDKKIQAVLHFHGGAYVTISPGVAIVQSGPRLFAAQLGVPVMLVDYRLACNPGGRHPAALQDIVAAYTHLLDQGVSPDAILLSGDSAGGHLILMLLRYLSETGILPTPKGAALWSPWTDMEMTRSGGDVAQNAVSDYVSPALFEWTYRDFLPEGCSADTPYFSPATYPFATPTRLFVASSDAEVLNDQHRKFRDAFQGVKGNTVGYSEARGSPHDLFAGGDTWGYAKQQEDVIKEALAFLTV